LRRHLAKVAVAAINNRTAIDGRRQTHIDEEIGDTFSKPPPGVKEGEGAKEVAGERLRSQNAPPAMYFAHYSTYRTRPRGS